MRPDYQIHISSSQCAVEVSEEELLHAARLTLYSEGIVEAEISIALVDDETIHQVNRDYLQHDYPTDVISFLLESGDVDPRGVSGMDAVGKRGYGQWICGEVILSGDTAVREAIEYEWEPQAEVVLYLVHGLLHLCGYDDQTDEQQQIMRAREREILHDLGWEARYAAD